VASVITLGLCGIAGAWLFGVGMPETRALPRPFGSEAWKAADTNADTRCSMVMDLRHRIGLVGKTEMEVVRLLGEDDDQASGPPRIYLLCPSFMDVYILEIEWRNGRVVSTRVRDT